MRAQTHSEWRKPWNKNGRLQELIAAHLKETDTEIAEVAIRELEEFEIVEALAYAISHLRPTVLTKVDPPKQRMKRRRDSLQRKQLVDEGKKRFATLLMNMTGAQVRLIQGLPKSTFKQVADNQMVGEVFTLEQIMNLMKGD